MDVIAGAGVWLPGKRRFLPPHRNEGLEIVCVSGGQGNWHIEGRVNRVRQGSIFFTWPWEQHGGVHEIEGGLDLSFVIIRLDRTYRRQPPTFRWHRDVPLRPAEAREIAQTLIAARTRTPPLTDRLARIIRQLAAEHEQADTLSGVVTRALAAAALVELARILRQPGDDPRHQLPAESRVEAFVRQLPDRCEQPWSVHTMARACRLSRSRFTDLVRRQSGDPPLMLLNRLRVERAARQLAGTDAKVIQIALNCGFSSPQYFCRVFRDYTGVTPLAWRRRGSNGQA